MSIGCLNLLSILSLYVEDVMLCMFMYDALKRNDFSATPDIKMWCWCILVLPVENKLRLSDVILFSGQLVTDYFRVSQGKLSASASESMSYVWRKITHFFFED